MEDTLIELLATLDYPVFRQGSLTENEPYPNTFFTFWNDESPDHSYYDNNDYGTAWVFSFYVYSNDPQITYDALMSARTILKQNNWIVPGKGYDVTSDEPTHTGRGIQVYYLET